MLIHEVTATLRPALELRHPDAEILFGATFNTDSGHKDAGVALIRVNGHPFEVEYSIQLGAVCLSEKDMAPIKKEAAA